MLYSKIHTTGTTRIWCVLDEGDAIARYILRMNIKATEQSFLNSTCLVTGGAGFIGSHLVERLVTIGATVRVLDNLSTGFLKNLEPLKNRIQWIEGDSSDAGVTRTAVNGCHYVFHLAALASVPQSMAEPLRSHQHCATNTLTILDAAANAKVKRVVFAGSSSAYGDEPFVSKRETDPLAPLSPYAAAKLAGEMYCRAYAASFGLETVVLRYFNIFGPRQDPNSQYSAVIPRFVAKILSGEQPIVYGDGGQSRDFCYVQNVVDANLLAATVPNASGTVANIGCGQSTTLLELLEQLSRLLGEPITAKFEPARAGDVRQSLADITTARTVLGYEPRVSVVDGLRESIEYYRKLYRRS